MLVLEILLFSCTVGVRLCLTHFESQPVLEDNIIIYKSILFVLYQIKYMCILSLFAIYNGRFLYLKLYICRIYWNNNNRFLFQNFSEMFIR